MSGDAMYSTPVDKPCFFCDKVGNRKEMRKAATIGFNANVKECALALCDKRLIAKLAEGDIIAQDAVYHRPCLTQLYRKMETVGCDITEDHSTQVIKAHVLNELVDYIENKLGLWKSLTIADLTALYDKRLAVLGFHERKCHTTRLRQAIARMILDIKPVQMKNSTWTLVFDEDLSQAVADMKRNTSTDVATHHKAARILRREYLSTAQDFKGSFSDACEANSIPHTLRSFMHVLLDGPGIDQPPPTSDKSKVATTIGQQIIFNYVGLRSKKPESVPRHIRERETLASVYMAMKLFLQTGSESLIDVMHQRGICISYDRLRVLSTYIANSVIAHLENVGVVVPPQDVKRVFTTYGFDNIDHNPSSTTANSALHRTCVSIHQHFSSDTLVVENPDDILNTAEMGKKIVRPVSATYTTVDLDISLPNNEVLHVPALSADIHPYPTSRSLATIVEESYVWLEQVINLISKGALESGDWISLAAYNASITEPPATPPTKSYMLPLFIESHNSPIMVWHGMKVNRQEISISTSGKAQSFIGDHHICRTRYMHQVSVAALYMLMKAAYMTIMLVRRRRTAVVSLLKMRRMTISLIQLMCGLRSCAPRSPKQGFKSMELDLLILQSGHVWGNTLIKDPAPVSPTEWGWQQTSPYSAPTPVYTTTPTIARDLPQLVVCQCKTYCKIPCKCCVSCIFLCRCQCSCSHTVAMRAVQTPYETVACMRKGKNCVFQLQFINHHVHTSHTVTIGMVHTYYNELL